METISKKIKKEIDEALIEVKSPIKPEINTSSEYELLGRMGLDVIETRKVKTYKITEEAYKDELNYFNFITELKKNPNYKIVDFKTLDSVMKRWNLVMGPLSQYRKELPIKNAKEFITYNELLKSNKRGHSTIMAYPETPYSLSSSEANNDIEAYRLRYKTRPRDVNYYYIIAPKEDFEQTNIQTCGTQLYWHDFNYSIKFKPDPIPNPDPIIVRGIADYSKNIFDIVTAWGREAGDKDIVNTNFN